MNRVRIQRLLYIPGLCKFRKGLTAAAAAAAAAREKCEDKSRGDVMRLSGCALPPPQLPLPVGGDDDEGEPCIPKPAPRNADEEGEPPRIAFGATTETTKVNFTS